MKNTTLVLLLLSCFSCSSIATTTVAAENITTATDATNMELNGFKEAIKHVHYLAKVTIIDVEIISEDDLPRIIYSNQQAKSTSPIESPTFSKLKRSQAFTDLPNMDEFSSVTFTSSLISTDLSKSDSPYREDSQIQPDLTDDSNHVNYVEEKKFIIKGIKVRAAKISKLVQILLDSFGKLNQFEHLFFDCFNYGLFDYFRQHGKGSTVRLFSTSLYSYEKMVHRINLIEILFDLYNLYNQYQDYYQQLADKQYYANQQLKICHAFKYVKLYVELISVIIKLMR